MSSTESLPPTRCKGFSSPSSPDRPLCNSTEGTSPLGKWAMRTSEHPPPSSAKILNTRSHTFTIQDISGGIQTGYGMDDRGLIPSRCKRFFSTSERPHRLCGTPSLLSNAYQGPFPGELSGWGAKLTIQFHLVQKSTMVELYLNFPYVFMVWCLIS
jgi:hypothetical protein